MGPFHWGLFRRISDSSEILFCHNPITGCIIVKIYMTAPAVVACVMNLCDRIVGLCDSKTNSCFLNFDKGNVSEIDFVVPIPRLKY